jgi:hypothetical protein
MEVHARIDDRDDRRYTERRRFVFGRSDDCAGLR